MLPPEAPGEVTYGESFTVQPFGNSLVAMTLTGAELDTLLEQQWCNQAAAKVLQVSASVSYTWSSGAPTCDRVDASTIKINGVTVDLDAFAAYLEANSPLAPPAQGRITVVP